MARAKFKIDTVHPFYGEIKAGEVLKVSYEYLLDYIKLEIAEETDDTYTRKGEELEA